MLKIHLPELTHLSHDPFVASVSFPPSYQPISYRYITNYAGYNSVEIYIHDSPTPYYTIGSGANTYVTNIYSSTGEPVTCAEVMLSAQPTSQNIIQGESVAYAINLTRSNYVEPVDLVILSITPSQIGFLSETTSDSSLGIDAYFNPDPVVDDSSELIVQTSPSTPEGTYLITISGTEVIQPATVTVTVLPPTYTLTVTPKKSLADGSLRTASTGKPTEYSMAEVKVTRTPATPGSMISLSANRISNSGGHIEDKHTGTPPVGGFNQASGTTDINGVFRAMYTAPATSGEISISANSEDKEIGSKDVLVKVSGLVPLASGTNYRLTGGTVAHPSGDDQTGINHYGTPETVTHLQAIAAAYEEMFYPGPIIIPAQSRLKFNDMSLPYGGKFEVVSNSSAPVPWNASSHNEHRIGINCDVSSSNVPRDRRTELVNIFINNGSPRFLDETSSSNHWHLRFE